MAERGGDGAKEDADAIEWVRKRLLEEGESRFGRLLRNGTGYIPWKEDVRPYRERFGWIVTDVSNKPGDDADPWLEVLIPAETFRGEFLKGSHLSERDVLRALDQGGFLLEKDKKGYKHRVRVPTVGLVSVVHINPSVMETAES